MGKDEKLRLRFDSSEAKRERCRRQRPEGRGALAPSNPSPPPSPHVMPSIIYLRYSIFCPTGKDEKLRLRFDSSEARERCRRQRPEGRGALAPSNPSPPPSLHVLPSLFHLRYAIFCPTGKDEKLRLRFDSSEARERCRWQWPEGEAL